MQAWRPGEEGGAAIWDALTGAVNPSGRLAQGWVRHVGAIHGPASPWFQQRGFPGAAYVTEPATPWFPFGFGLSYSNFSLSNVALSPPGPYSFAASAFNVTVTVRSSGPAGAVVVQIYFSQDPPTATVRYGRALLCFGKAVVPANSPGTSVSVACDAADTLWYDPGRGNYIVYAGNYTLYVGQSSADPAMATLPFSIVGGW